MARLFFSGNHQRRSLAGTAADTNNQVRTTKVDSNNYDICVILCQYDTAVGFHQKRSSFPALNKKSFLLRKHVQLSALLVFHDSRSYPLLQCESFNAGLGQMNDSCSVMVYEANAAYDHSCHMTDYST